MAVEPTLLFDGARLRATVFHPAVATGNLIVSFRHRVVEPGTYGAPTAIGRFVDRGWTHLHIESRYNDWYVNAETQPLSAVLAPFTAGFQHVAGMGFSMGGYACLRLSAALNLAEAVVVSPQYSIHPDVVPFEKRYLTEAEGFDRGLGALDGHARSGLRGVVIFDPFRRLDLGHARLIAAALPDLALCRYCFGGHPATGVLRETVKFAAVQELVLRRQLQRAAVLALHRANRAASPRWWRALAKRAEKTGHHNLSQTAWPRLPA